MNWINAISVEEPDLWAHIWHPTTPGHTTPTTIWWAPAQLRHPYTAPQAETYISMGLKRSQVQPGNNVRVKAHEVEQLLCTGWIDIDIQCDWHAKKGLPATLEEAHQFLATLPWEPTVIQQTPGGIQAFWLPAETEPTTNQKIIAHLEGLKQTIEHYAKVAGITIDPVWNPDRLMRHPHSPHHKTGTTVEVTKTDGPRWTMTEMQERMVEISVPLPATTTATTNWANTQITNPHNQPHPDTIFAVKTVCGQQTWLDLTTKTGKYPSDSEADAALAYHATKLQTQLQKSGENLTDTEIARLITWRRTLTLAKTKRDDYYRRTIAAAKTLNQATAEATEKKERTQTLIHAIETDQPLPPKNDPNFTERKTEKKARLTRLSETLSGSTRTPQGTWAVTIKKITATKPEGAGPGTTTWQLHTTHGPTTPLNATQLGTQRPLSDTLFETCGRTIPHTKQEEWRAIIHEIYQLADQKIGAPELDTVTVVVHTLQKIAEKEQDLHNQGHTPLTDHSEPRSWDHPQKGLLILSSWLREELTNRHQIRDTRLLGQAYETLQWEETRHRDHTGKQVRVKQCK